MKRDALIKRLESLEEVFVPRGICACIVFNAGETKEQAYLRHFGDANFQIPTASFILHIFPPDYKQSLIDAEKNLLDKKTDTHTQSR